MKNQAFGQEFLETADESLRGGMRLSYIIEMPEGNYLVSWFKQDWVWTPV